MKSSGQLQQKSKKEKEKALAKILDSNTVHSRVKALKTCLESLVADEMKRYLCENNYAYFYVWYDFYTLHVDPAIKNLGNKALSKDVKDDVDTLLFVIEKLIHLMPEKLASGWHCNSISAFLKRLVTPECCTRYRYVGIRLFLAWFQVVRDKAPADMVFLFSTLVPGLDQTKLTPSDPNRTSRTSLVAPGTLGNLPGGTSQQQQQHQVVSVSGSPSGFNSSGSAVDPLVPASQAELAQNTLDQEAIRILEIILEHLISNVTLTCWTDSKGRVEAFRFMLREFRQKFLFKIFQDYNHKMDLYSTAVPITPTVSHGANSPPPAGTTVESTVGDNGDGGTEDNEMRGMSGSGSSSSGLGGAGSGGGSGGVITGEERDLIVQMKVRVIQWIIQILPPTKTQRRRTITASESDADPKAAAATSKTLPNPLLPGGGGMLGSGKNLLLPSAVAGGSVADSMSLTSSAHFPPRLLMAAAAGRGGGGGEYHVRDEATLIAYQVFTSNKENVNMCLEILRQALLLPLNQCETTHNVINLVTSWLDCSEEEKPEFVKEEFSGTNSRHGTLGGFGEQGETGEGTGDGGQIQSTTDASKSSPVAAAAATSSKSGRCISVVVMDSSPSALHAQFSPSISGTGGGVRAGLESYLRYLFRALSVVFYIQHKGASHKMDVALNETRNKVVQVFRKVSLSRDTLTHPLIETAPTWYHAISTLSRATRFLFQNDRHLLKVNEQFLSNLLNTLLVSCLMSNLFVRMSTSIWDDLTQLISQVAHKSPVVIDQWIKTTRFLTTKILSPQVFGIEYSTIEDAIRHSPASGGVGQSTHGGSCGNDWKRSVKKISTSSTLRAAAAVSSRGGNSSSSSGITASHHHSHSHPAHIQSQQSGVAGGNSGGQFQTSSTGLKPKRPVVASGSDTSSFGESLTTQTLTAMLRNPPMPDIPSVPNSRDGARRGGGGLEGFEVARRRTPGGSNNRASVSRPTSLYVTSGEVGKGKGSRGSKNYRRKTGAVAANLYSSRSETCIYTASNEDSFTKTIDKGTKASAGSDGQKQKPHKSKRGLLRGSTSRLDSGSFITTDDDFDSDNTANNAFELSYDTDTFHDDLLTKQLIINVEDATPSAGGTHSTQSNVVADDEMSTSSHDTQMSWLQATADGLSRPPKQRTGGISDMATTDTSHDAEKSKDRHFSSPSRSRGDSNSSHGTCYSASGSALPVVHRRQKAVGESGGGNPNRPRPQSVVETTFSSTGRSGDASSGTLVVDLSQSATASQMASAKTTVGLRNSWCVGYALPQPPRRIDSSSGLVRFAEDVSLSEQTTTDHGGMSDQEEEEDSAVFQHDSTLSPRDASLISDAPESVLGHTDHEAETPIGHQANRVDLIPPTRVSVSSSENGDEFDESGGGGNRRSRNSMGSGYGLDSSWNTENRSLIMGGNLTGWTREAAFMLWRRVLGIIGDVNQIGHEDTKAVVFSHLLDLHDILQNIANHQKFVDEETGQFCLPAYVPPVPILLPWAIEACRVNATNPNPNSSDIMGHNQQSALLQQSQIRVGTSTLLAHKLAARTVLKYPALDTGIISSFYQIVYENLKLGNAYLDELFVKELYTLYGCRLPGSMVLLKVLVDNATTVMDRFYNQTSIGTSISVDLDCVEKAVLFLGSLVSFPDQHSTWTCLTGRLRGKTETVVYPMTQLAQSITTALTHSARNPAMCLQAACRSLSTLSIAAICSILNPATPSSSSLASRPKGDATGSTDASKEVTEPSYRYEQSLYELFCHLKFERIQEATSGAIINGGNTKRFLTTCEFSMAQLSACHILTIFDALLATDADASTLHEVVTSLIASVVNLVKNFLPDQKMLSVVVSLLCTINDCVSKLPIDILIYSEVKRTEHKTNPSESGKSGDDAIPPESAEQPVHAEKHSTASDLPQAVHKGLTMVLAQCRKWLNQLAPMDSESMNGSENSIEQGVTDSSVPHQPNARTGSSSSSSNVSASMKMAEADGGPVVTGGTPSVSGLSNLGSTRGATSHGASPVAKDQIEIVEQIQQTTDLVSNIMLGLIGQYPSVEGGVTKLDSCITEAHNNPAAGVTNRNAPTAGRAGSGGGGIDAMHFSLIDNDYTQTFVYNDNTVITVLELPRDQQQVGSEDEDDARGDPLDSSADSRRVVRFIIRDLSGKYCFDFIPSEDDESDEQDLNTSEETQDEDTRTGLDTTLPDGDLNTGGEVGRRADTLEGYSHTLLIESSDSSDNVQVYGSSPESSHMPMSILRTSHTTTGAASSEGSHTMTRDDTINGTGGSGYPSLSTDVVVDPDGDEGERTEHGDTTQSTTLKFDILDYLDSPVWDVNRVPNALNEVLGFLSTSEDLLDYPGQRLDAPRGLQGLMERRFREEIEGMQETMLEKERREMEIGRRQPLLTFNSDNNSATLLGTGNHHTGNSPEMEQNRHQLRGEENRPFQTSARLLMQLNCFSWANRKLLHLLNKCPSLMKELKHLDSQSLRDAHKIAVVYVGSGQETKSAILSNSAGSTHYEAFLHALGWEVDIETHKGYLGMLKPSGTSGKTMLYFASPTYEIAYHVVTRMLGTDDQKWRHVGNDHVHVVWNEHCRPYVRSVMPTQFADVLITLTPLQQSQQIAQQQQLQQPMMLVNISCKHPMESHLLGPLFDGAIVEACVLPQLVRATAVRASQLVKQGKNSPIFYSSRQQTIQTIVKRFKLHQTFEDFVAEAVNPHSRGSGAGGTGTGHNTSLSASSLTQSNRSSVNVGSVAASGGGSAGSGAGGGVNNNTATLVASDSWDSAMHHHHQPQQSYHAPQSSRETSIRSDSMLTRSSYH